MPPFQMDQSLPPGLYIVATPIGNLGDITSRAAETLCRVDHILAEDKRVTAKLLAHVGATAPMTAYHDHSDEKLRERILGDLGDQGGGAGQRRRHAADLRPRLQAGPRGAARRVMRSTPCPAPAPPSPR